MKGRLGNNADCPYTNFWNTYTYTYEMHTHIHTTQNVRTHTYEMLSLMYVKHIHTLIYENLKFYKDE